MKTSKSLLCLIGAALFLAYGSAVFAESFPDKSGYLIDSRGNVVKNAYGECWRTGYWTPALAIAECDPDLVKTAIPIAEVKPPVVSETPRAIPPAVIHINAETLFDFDKAEVKPEGQKILDEKIVSSMKQHPEGKMLVITGHADRIGSETYNQRLSERRANAVKTYLVKQGLVADNLSASGKGESEPDPAANTSEACKGLRGNKLISCLQPDRRVTVEPASAR